LVDYRGKSAMGYGGVGGTYYKEEEFANSQEEAMSVQPRRGCGKTSISRK
jgi:hypothetical protein